MGEVNGDKMDEKVKESQMNERCGVRKDEGGMEEW